MERVTHNFAQQSPEWFAFRFEHDGASEAAAMLGLSKTTKRNELLHIKHTGLGKEFSDYVQKKILDKGHEVEVLARPIAEEMIGEPLYPVTCSYGRLSASCDGLTLEGETAFEHKQFNADLFAAVKRNELPEEHQPQCQQVMLVTGATRLFFVCSDGTLDNFAGMWVYPDPDWIDRIIGGWGQFAEDLAAYVPAEPVVIPVAAPIRDLPAIRYQLNGLALTSNLSEFKAAALVLVEDSKKELTTDQDFVNRDALNKKFKAAEEAIEMMCAQVVSEIEDVDKFTRDLREVAALVRQARLTGEKNVESRKKAIKEKAVQRGKDELAAHITAITKTIGKDYMPVVPADFGKAISGLKKLDSLNNAIDTELARAKIEADAISRRIMANMKLLDENADYVGLFPDTAQLVLKSTDDLVSLAKVRIAEHKEAEAKRVEAARVAKEKADAAVVVSPPVATSVPVTITPMSEIMGAAPVTAPTIAQPACDGTAALRAAINEAMASMNETELKFLLDGARNICQGRKRSA